MKVLFVTWDGPQVDYLESLFLPIFSRLAEDGVSFHILQFTWGDPKRETQTRDHCRHAGCTYETARIWRRPRALGALLTSLFGAVKVGRAIRRHDIDVVMPRSVLPALSTLLARRARRCAMVFDADGLPLDERVDFAGQSPFGLAHRFLRDIEAQAARRADVVLVRTRRAADIIMARAGAGTDSRKFKVVCNGRDPAVYSPRAADKQKDIRQTLKISLTAPLVIYAGSLGPQYCVVEMLEIFEQIKRRRPKAHLVILTRTPEALAPALQRFDTVARSMSVLAVSSDVVPGYLSCADVGLALRQHTFSMQAVAPIKLGEYLLCGVPVIASCGVGNTEEIEPNSGFLMDTMTQKNLDAAALWFTSVVLPQRDTFRASCRALGVERFSLDASVAEYRSALSALDSTIFKEQQAPIK